MPWWGIVILAVYLVGWIASCRWFWKKWKLYADEFNGILVIPALFAWLPAIIGYLVWHGFGWLFGFERHAKGEEDE